MHLSLTCRCSKGLPVFRCASACTEIDRNTRKVPHVCFNIFIATCGSLSDLRRPAWRRPTSIDEWRLTQHANSNITDQERRKHNIRIGNDSHKTGRPPPVLMPTISALLGLYVPG